MMAGVAIMNVFMSNCTTGEICYQLLIAILCIATILQEIQIYRFVHHLGIDVYCLSCH